MGEGYYESSQAPERYASSQAPERYATSQANLDHGPSDTSSRVSDWVESSGAVVPHNPGTVVSRSAPAPEGDAPPRILRRTVTTTTTTTYERTPTSSDDGGVVGAVAGILGAAVGMGVGAALSYNSMKTDTARPSQPEQSTRLLQPMSSHPRGAGSEKGDWVEVDRATELPQYLAEYGYGAVPSAARSMASTRPRTVVSGTQEPLLLTAAEARSQVGSQCSKALPSNTHRKHSGDAASHVSMRSRASGATARPPATQAPPSQAGSRYSAAPKSSVHRGPADMDSASRVSARTQRPPGAPSQHGGRPAPSAHGGSVARSKAGSTMSASTTKAPTVIRTSAPSNAGRKGSVASARHVPLPKSTAGSSHSSRWDDLESIAPSESISCVDGPRSRVYC